VLAFTPDVEEVLQLFRLTYELHGGFGWVQWQRRALPETGGIVDQPARVMEALAHVAREENAALHRAQKEPPREDGETPTPRRRRRRG
jgi:hypothetical protein